MASQKLLLKDNKNVAIVYRLQTAEAVSMAKKISLWLKEKGYEVFTAPQQTAIPGTKVLKTKAGIDKIGLVIALGGDGTYLRAVRSLEGRQIPIIGINMGSLGFLTGNRAEDAFRVLEETLESKMELRPRSMIHIMVRRKTKIRAEYHALNDVVIERGSGSHLISTAIYSEKFLVSEVKADGFIIASPTGSTAYNLAAGGPILHPEAKVFVVTPVAPHSLTSRPLILPDDLHMSFKMDSRSQRAQLIVDGQNETEITPDDEVIIKRSGFDHLMVRAPKHNYFHLLREKLKFGDRA
ncbi:NAD(+)/NADH kinase [Bdellovibrio sp. HCB337]|uniref:NAD(+)/NADH kinase n=1 Tax=Bdellovibrio sp. HCB337 TaxID=3394358 RepID=UPI0039A68BD3